MSNHWGYTRRSDDWQRLEGFDRGLLLEIEQGRPSSSEIGFPLSAPLSERDRERAPTGGDYHEFTRLFVHSVHPFSRSVSQQDILERMQVEFVADVRRYLSQVPGKIWWHQIPEILYRSRGPAVTQYKTSCSLAVGDLTAEGRESNGALEGSPERGGKVT